MSKEQNDKIYNEHTAEFNTALSLLVADLESVKAVSGHMNLNLSDDAIIKLLEVLEMRKRNKLLEQRMKPQPLFPPAIEKLLMKAGASLIDDLTKEFANIPASPGAVDQNAFNDLTEQLQGINGSWDITNDAMVFVDDKDRPVLFVPITNLGKIETIQGIMQMPFFKLDEFLPVYKLACEQAGIKPIDLTPN